MTSGSTSGAGIDPASITWWATSGTFAFPNGILNSLELSAGFTGTVDVHNWAEFHAIVTERTSRSVTGAAD